MTTKLLYAAACLLAASCTDATVSTDEPSNKAPLSTPSPAMEAPSLAPTRFVTADEMKSWFPSLDFAPSETPTDAGGRPLAYAMIGQTFPDFTLPLSTGGSLSRSDLEGKWTVVDFWGLWCSDCLADAPYVSALRSALNQDPDVDLVSIHTPPNKDRADEAFGKWGSLEAWFADKGGEPYPVAIDADASLRDAADIYWTPTYLLLAPDLTIHGFRTDLSVDDSDGIKPVVRQISELRSAWEAAQPSADDQALAGADATPGPQPTAPPSVISSLGLAGLSGQTPFEAWALKKAFDEYDVLPAETMEEGITYPIFEVAQDGKTIATIHADASEQWVYRVKSLSTEFTGPLGERIGSTRLRDVPADMLGDCLPGVDEYYSSLMCMADRPASFVRVFDVGDAHAGQMNSLPEDVRENAVLKELHYLPPLP